MCSKFKEGLTLKIRKKMYVFDNQSYKKVVQLALRMKKLTSKRMSQGSFQNRKGFGFMSGQSSKKIRSFDSSENFSGFGIGSISSPQATQSPQSSRLGMSPSIFAFRGRSMSEKCLCCRQFYLKTCGAP